MHTNPKPSPAAVQSPRSGESVVPVIDLQPYYKGTTAQVQQLAHTIGEACRTIGFLTVVRHNVPEFVIRDMQRVTHEFFDQPLSVKQAIPMTEDYPYGYSGYLEENLSSVYYTHTHTSSVCFPECFIRADIHCALCIV
jgi:isopenicillin N synthase-like dioxygenase